MNTSKSEDDWKKELPKDVYQVCRLGATEPPFSGEYVYHHEDGIYKCRACRAPLFSSHAKYDSKSGWPSFFEPISKGALDFLEDDSHGMHRIEVKCHACNSHLGHLFEDGPQPTYERFCINSKALKFESR